jgi:hypothetical protein
MALARSELLRAVPRRRRGRRWRSGCGRRFIDGSRRGRSRHRWRGVRLVPLRLTADHIHRRRSRGSFVLYIRTLEPQLGQPGLSRPFRGSFVLYRRTFEPQLCGRLRVGDDPRQTDVIGQRRRLGRAQEGWQGLQREQRRDGDDRHLADTAPVNSHRAHPCLRAWRAPVLPPQVARAASMSLSWSSTQSPGLREKMISFRPCDQARFCSGSIVSAR